MATKAQIGAAPSTNAIQATSPSSPNTSAAKHERACQVVPVSRHSSLRRLGVDEWLTEKMLPHPFEKVAMCRVSLGEPAGEDKSLTWEIIDPVSFYCKDRTKRKAAEIRARRLVRPIRQTDGPEEVGGKIRSRLQSMNLRIPIHDSGSSSVVIAYGIQGMERD